MMKTKRATGEFQRKTPDTVSVLYCHLKANVAAVVTERRERRNSRGPSFFVFCVAARTRIWCRVHISVDLPLSKYNR